jgi:hypothetical protein
MKKFRALLFVILVAALLPSCSGAAKHAGGGVFTEKPAQARLTKTTLDLSLLFNVPVVGSMQGIAYNTAKDCYYAAFDIGSGNAKFYTLSSSGVKTAATGALATGHSAEIAYCSANGCLYVTNGHATTSPIISVVNIGETQPKITKNIKNTAIKGYGALVCIDNTGKHMIISTNSIKIRTGKTAPKNFSSYVMFYVCDLNGKILKKFQLCYQGIPQGIEYDSGNIYFYTNNRIVVLSEDGATLEVCNFMAATESEGLAIANINGQKKLVVGYNSPNRFYTLGMNLSGSTS